MIRHKPIDPEHKNLTEEQQHFYSTLGILSVSYATMEFKIKELLAFLLNPDENSLGLTMVEQMSLHHNLDKLKKINPIIGFHEEKIKDIIKRIRAIQPQRNLFIHSIWYAPHPHDDTIGVHCDIRKVNFKKMSGEGHLSMNRIERYTLPEFQEIVHVINSIIADIEAITSQIIDDPSCLRNL